ncbi:MAG TPA: S8 family serine peptidase [Candidatus Dormibacteraeota bacterium]
MAGAALSLGSCAQPASSTPSPLPWHLAAIHAPEAWRVTQGEGEVIAVLDTGLTDLALPGLRKREVGPSPQPDTNGHGTAVTTLAAGSGDLGVWGVAPSARVLSISVLDTSGEISATKVVAGIYAAVAQGASVINMSFGQTSDNPLIRAAVDYAAGRGVVIVAAAGDTASPSPLFPADLAGEVIAVRALADNGAPPLSANTIGVNGIDAPGENLPALRVEGGVLVEANSDGSSMATAVVTGSVALLAACVHRKHGSMLNQQTLVRALHESAQHKPFFNLSVALHMIGC